MIFIYAANCGLGLRLYGSGLSLRLDCDHVLGLYIFVLFAALIACQQPSLSIRVICLVGTLVVTVKYSLLRRILTSSESSYRKYTLPTTPSTHAYMYLNTTRSMNRTACEL